MADYQIEDLLCLMRALRAPQYGCPWDRKQTFTSLVPHTLEEAYEVADAIAQSDMEALRLELGDLLFQVVFYAQLGAERRAFDFGDIVNGIITKLLRRHPHVFPEGSLASAGSRRVEMDEKQVKDNWEKIKAQEKKANGDNSLMDDIPVALPASMRAHKMQKRAATAGFDWPEHAGVMCKIEEELAELQQAIMSREKEKITEELGDVLFSCINLARHLEVDPDAALRATTDKFDRRFRHIETVAQQQGKRVSELTTNEMENAWNRAKQMVKDKPVE